MSSNTVRADVVDRLVAAGCVAAEAEAQELQRAAPDADALDSLVARREQGEPLAWITGTMVFAGRRVHVAPEVYVPRVQSEELAMRASALLPAHGLAVDLCTGAGAIAAHLQAEVPSATVIGVDLDVRAAACARRNDVCTVVADLAAPLRSHADVDVITAVAPYVPTAELRLLPADVQRHEPRAALDGGRDGLDLVRRVVAASGALLRGCGWLLIELGGDQADALADTLATLGFTHTEAWYDDDGDLRGMAAQRRD